MARYACRPIPPRPEGRGFSGFPVIDGDQKRKSAGERRITFVMDNGLFQFASFVALSISASAVSQIVSMANSE